MKATAAVQTIAIVLEGLGSTSLTSLDLTRLVFIGLDLIRPDLIWAARFAACLTNSKYTVDSAEGMTGLCNQSSVALLSSCL